MTNPQPDAQTAVYRVVAHLHVADVEDSVSFYRLLGFEPDEWVRNADGQAIWACVKRIEPGGAFAEIHLDRASAPVIPEEQAILLYMYSRDVRGLRSHLIENGLHNGGKYVGQPGPNGGKRVVFDVYEPGHMPKGELRVADPDAYCLLIGQLGDAG